MKSIFLFLILFSINFIYAQQKYYPFDSSNTAVEKQILFEGLLKKNIAQNQSIKPLIVPVGLITYGFIALGNNGLKKINDHTKLELSEDHPTFITKADNYLQFAPAAAVYGLNAMGIKGKHNFRDRSMIYLMSNIILNSSVFFI